MTITLPRLKVLLIDDEHFIRSTLRQILTMLGVAPSNIYDVPSVADAMRETMRMRPDIVFCDIHMPGEDGFSYVEQTRKSPLPDVAGIPVIMLTSDSHEEAVLTAKQLRVQGYLVKPVSVNAVKIAVERALKVRLT